MCYTVRIGMLAERWGEQSAVLKMQKISCCCYSVWCVSVPEAAKALLKLSLLHVNAQAVVEDKTS